MGLYLALNQCTITIKLTYIGYTEIQKQVHLLFTQFIGIRKLCIKRRETVIVFRQFIVQTIHFIILLCQFLLLLGNHIALSADSKEQTYHHDKSNIHNYFCGNEIMSASG